MSKTTRIKRLIAGITKLQQEEGVNDAALGLAKAALSKVENRWKERDSIQRQSRHSSIRPQLR
jgi:hypothetical protein